MKRTVSVSLLCLGLVIVMVLRGSSALSLHRDNRREAVSNSSDNLVHDFGLVRPGTRVRHRYRIENPTESSWLIAKMVTSCGCAVPSMSSRLIPPGGVEHIDVQFTAPPVAGDYKKHVDVLFRDPSVPSLRLSLTATVRAPLYVSSKEVEVFPTVATEQITVERSIMIANYSDERWGGVTVSSNADWLNVSTTALQVWDGSDTASFEIRSKQPRQMWQATLRVDPEKVRAGLNRTLAVVQTVGNSPRWSDTIDVRFTRRPPVQVFPAAVFLRDGDRLTSKRLLVSVNGPVEISTSDVRVSHEFGGDLTHRLRKLKSNLFELDLQFTSRIDSRRTAGAISISVGQFADPVVVAVRSVGI